MLQALKKDLRAGLSVAIVAMPLSMAISVASDLPPTPGIIAALVGGIVVGFLTSCPLAIHGPAAGLISLLGTTFLAFSTAFGPKQGFVALQLATVVTGVISFVLGAFKFGSVGKIVPVSVVKGLTMAIGCLILAGQLPTLLGYKPDESQFFLKITFFEIQAWLPKILTIAQRLIYLSILSVHVSMNLI